MPLQSGASVLTVLEGSTFCICDLSGDIEAEGGGFFANDTRYLSCLRLTVDGREPMLLSSGTVEYFSAAFFLRNPPVPGLGRDSVAIARHRFVGRALHDLIVLENLTLEPVSCTLGLELASDFADIFAVKARDLSFGDPEHAAPLPAPVAPETDAACTRLRFTDPEGFGSTAVLLSRAGSRTENGLSYAVELPPHGRWELTVDVVPVAPGEQVPEPELRRFGEARYRVRESLAAWRLSVPHVEAEWDGLERAVQRSVSDLAALRIRGDGDPHHGRLPAAGMPWFMTVFGRDTIIAALQTMLLGSELARGALEELTELQAREDEPELDAEPGKIVHEVRRGKGAAAWFARYYGTIDATPLYLVLLSEAWRWTGDTALAQKLREPALRALAWIDRDGDRDGDGFIEYERRSQRGLANQSWKDSEDSQRFADGRIAAPPIAPCEAQGYVFDAKLRMAELAADAWGDDALARRLRAEALALQVVFDDAFWVDRRGGYYALALDGGKRPVDALCSNIGHLLWSGIVPAEKVDAVVARLFSDELWSGWGVRTMSTADAGYNPISYHNGTVWPHDNSLIAAGLARYGRWDEAWRLCRRLIEAAGAFDDCLPEVFSGFPRETVPFPIAYPTAARPQAWAAGTPLLLVQTALGLYADRERGRLASAAPDCVPAWASLRLDGVAALGTHWNVRAAGGRVTVEEE